jgi:5-(carboxyamino)imidazole ribonucleotide mutase
METWTGPSDAGAKALHRIGIKAQADRFRLTKSSPGLYYFYFRLENTKNIGSVSIMSRVGIIMGSDSDLAIMKDACDILDQFEIKYEVTVCSAHRLPEETAAFAREAIDRGLEVIIAGAGGAAHLPGVVAAYTVLPVIGVPIKTSTLSGVDSLYSIVQMPRGIPVATVAINGSANAALLALEIMAVKETELRNKLIAYRQQLAHDVRSRDRKLQELGPAGYLKFKEENK